MPLVPQALELLEPLEPLAQRAAQDPLVPLAVKVPQVILEPLVHQDKVLLAPLGPLACLETLVVPLEPQGLKAKLVRRVPLVQEVIRAPLALVPLVPQEHKEFKAIQVVPQVLQD